MIWTGGIGFGHCVRKEKCDLAIHMVHGLLADRSLGNIIRHTVVDRILTTEADLTLAGHYHLGFPPVEVDDRYFLNPGALVRVNNHPSEISRRPAVILIDLSGGAINYQLLHLQSALPGKLVLDREQVELKMQREERLADFVRGVKAAGEYYGLDLGEMVATIAAKETLSPAVREEALRRLALAQEDFQTGGARA